jgi:hypothetical protein
MTNRSSKLILGGALALLALTSCSQPSNRLELDGSEEVVFVFREPNTLTRIYNDYPNIYMDDNVAAFVEVDYLQLNRNWIHVVGEDTEALDVRINLDDVVAWAVER